ncbi:hypothetical protein Y1Q_0020527 [Alligator mississippiensis]|uniref:Uncharacterized protein n=1 Tax=Alligator mississippiensis TaxID=8496 RepID=A0A151LY01_ALLMI|nr:hypothetical protein Y1Q_0020527 [Alligator mississippiensis]
MWAGPGAAFAPAELLAGLERGLAARRASRNPRRERGRLCSQLTGGRGAWECLRIPLLPLASWKDGGAALGSAAALPVCSAPPPMVPFGICPGDGFYPFTSPGQLSGARSDWNLRAGPAAHCHQRYFACSCVNPVERCSVRLHQ